MLENFKRYNLIKERSKVEAMHRRCFVDFDKMLCIAIVCTIAFTQCSANYFTSNPENFQSVPTTIKTNENDTVLLPCYSVGEFALCGFAFIMFGFG